MTDKFNFKPFILFNPDCSNATSCLSCLKPYLKKSFSNIDSHIIVSSFDLSFEELDEESQIVFFEYFEKHFPIYSKNIILSKLSRKHFIHTEKIELLANGEIAYSPGSLTFDIDNENTKIIPCSLELESVKESFVFLKECGFSQRTKTIHT